MQLKKPKRHIIASLKLNIENVEGNGIWLNPCKNGESERFVSGQQFPEVLHNITGLVDELEKVMGQMDKIFASTGYPKKTQQFISGILYIIVLVLIYALYYLGLDLGLYGLICLVVFAIFFVLLVFIHKNVHNSRKNQLNACITAFNDNHRNHGVYLAFNEDYDAYAKYLIDRRLWGKKCCLTNPEEVWSPALHVIALQLENIV